MFSDCTPACQLFPPDQDLRSLPDRKRVLCHQMDDFLPPLERGGPGQQVCKVSASTCSTKMNYDLAKFDFVCAVSLQGWLGFLTVPPPVSFSLPIRALGLCQIVKGCHVIGWTTSYHLWKEEDQGYRCVKVQPPRVRQK